MAIDTSDFSSNTPLKTVPSDYFPAGSDRWFVIPDGPDAGKRMFYADIPVGEGDGLPVVLFVHGNPECSYTYRKIRDRLIELRAPCRLILPDHVGFGLSDQATYEPVDMHHAANLRQLVEHLDLRNVTLVIHDWGGPIGCGAFADEPERVSSLLVMNSTIFPMPPDGLTYENFPISWFPWCRTPHLIPDALWGAVAARVVSHAEPQSTAAFLAGATSHLALEAMGLLGRDPESPDAVFAGMFRSKANARASKRHVLQTPVWGHGYVYDDPVLGRQDNHGFYRKIQDVVPRAWGRDGRNVPTAGFFGSWDPCGKASVIAQWHEALPRMKESTRVFPEHGHFIEEWRGAEMADVIAGWI